MSEKTKGEQLREELLMNPKNLTETMTAEELKAAYDFCEGYKSFLDAAKTEREAVTTAIALLEKAGYVPFDHAAEYKAGDKVYLNNRGKALIAATIGRRSVAEGVRIGVAHIDSPRLDLKPRPLFEEGEQCFLKTHYYGGIKKYQWTAIPLALHGTIIRKEHLLSGRLYSNEVFLFVDEEVPGCELLPAGSYVCLCSEDFSQEAENVERLLAYVGEHHCQVAGDYLCEVMIDFPMLEFDRRQMFYKTQIPVRFFG